MFGLQPSFDVDLHQLAARYRNLQRECHPDLHGDKGAAERDAVATRAAFVNHAYTVLRRPYDRVRAFVWVRRATV